MQYINNTQDEETVCNNSLTKTRQNSQPINYLNKVNDKPWGKEYLSYQNKKIGIWILYVNKEQETSLHCHFKKDTILINISGCFKINLYNDYKILNLFECLYVPRNTFHGIHSYTDNSILMEIEIYTQSIQYTDKNDLLRIKDKYSRDKTNYETSVKEREPTENEIMNFDSHNTYSIGDTDIFILELTNFTDIKTKYEKVIILEGCVYSDGKRITAGSFIDLEKKYSFLTDNVKVLCLSSINYNYLDKIIYSKSHLIDYLAVNKIRLNKIGLTSGCFDILHEGHINNLKICKNNCDYLFVGLSSDTQIKRLKGKQRPINNIKDRIHMLIHFDFIDKIILYDETDDNLETELDNIMNIVNPYVWIKGNDYKKEDILKKHPSLKNINLINLVEGKSTTTIINKIMS